MDEYRFLVDDFFRFFCTFANVPFNIHCINVRDLAEGQTKWVAKGTSSQFIRNSKSKIHKKYDRLSTGQLLKKTSQKL